MVRQKKHIAPDVPAWFQHLRKQGLQDMKLLCPLTVKDRQLFGFSNTTESSILWFFGNGNVTCFAPNWQFDAVEKHWNVRYTGHQWPNPPAKKPEFENNTDSFRKVLADIRELALKIDCDDFANIFADAISLLNGSDEYPDPKYGLKLPEIPEQNLQLFEAASRADVFDAMGSWNDSPPYLAHEKGLEKEYETLSAALLKNIRLAILYAVNEC